MNYIRHGLQEMGFNDDLNLDRIYYVKDDAEFYIFLGHIKGEPFFEKIKRHIDPQNNCKSYIINDREGNIYEVLQNDIDELGVDAPATLIREVIEE